MPVWQKKKHPRHELMDRHFQRTECFLPALRVYVAFEFRCQRALFVVDVFDLAVVKEAKRNVLRSLENDVARFPGDFLKIHVKSLRVLF